jgi:hypothetical protein
VGGPPLRVTGRSAGPVFRNAPESYRICKRPVNPRSRPARTGAKAARPSGVASVLLDTDRQVMRRGRRARVSRLCGGVSILRYWLVNDAVAGQPTTLSPKAAAADEPMTRERRSPLPVRGTVAG